MTRYSLYGEIKNDLRVIAKLVLDADDGFAEPRWQDVKASIHELAEQCLGLMKERKEAERIERREQRAYRNEQLKNGSASASVPALPASPPKGPVAPAAAKPRSANGCGSARRMAAGSKTQP